MAGLQDSRSTDHRLPLKSRPIQNHAHELSNAVALEAIRKDGVEASSAVALAGVREGQGAIQGLTFLLDDGWALEIPIDSAMAEQLRRIVGSMGDLQ